MIFHTARHAVNAFSNSAPRAEPNTLLMCSPEAFDVVDVKNAFMQPHVKVDKALAVQQWHALKNAFESVGAKVQVISGVEGLEDMVFCANQALVGSNANGPYALLSNMKHASRRAEVPHFEKFFRAHNCRVTKLETLNVLFEGHGDALWFPKKQFLLGGYGHRTHLAAYEEIATRFDLPIAVFELVTPQFYHLDTCLSIVNETTALCYPQAFSTIGYELLKTLFENLIAVSREEALEGFACNAAAVDGKHVIIQKGNSQAAAALRACNINVVEVDTSEFMKSGGSVFCMKTWCEINSG